MLVKEKTENHLVKINLDLYTLFIANIPMYNSMNSMFTNTNVLITKTINCQQVKTTKTEKINKHDLNNEINLFDLLKY